MLEVEIRVKWIPRRKGLLRGESWVGRRVFEVPGEWIDRGG